VPGVDVSGVDTPKDLAKCLDALRRRCGLSYEAMEKAAKRLPPQKNGPPWEPLGKSTVGEIVTGQRMPSKGKLRTFLAVCHILLSDEPQWLAAWDRAVTADLRRPSGALRVREMPPRELGVHAAIQVEGASEGLPVYVPRDLDDELRAALSSGAEQGCFVLLVGGSSVGKTRTLYEAVREVLPDWWLVHPGDHGEIRALADTPTPRTVVWLDELQRYLGADYGLTAGTVRALRRVGTVLVGTMWPEEYSIRIALPQSGVNDPYAGDRELLNLAQVLDVGTAFTIAEQGRARDLASRDARIRIALETPDAGLTQVLAAGPQLVRWWEHAPTSYGWAVITAAIDARRLGVDLPVTRGLLADAAPGYLQPAQRAAAPSDWLEQALDYATTPLHGAASALRPVDADAMGKIAGYVAADYLLQRARCTRRTTCPPAYFWQAVIDHVDNLDVIARLASHADRRMRYRYAIPLYKTLAKAGKERAVERLAHLLADQDCVDEAIDILRAQVGARHVTALRQLVELLIVRGRVGEAIEFVRPVAFDTYWGHMLDILLAKDGRVEELRARADAGEFFAAVHLADLLAEQGQIDELRARADAGSEDAAYRLADLLFEQGCVEAAIEVLRPNADASKTFPVERLADLLVQHDRVDEAIEILRARADTGEEHAAIYLVGVLAKQGRIDELRARADAGDELAATRLGSVLVQHDRVDEAIEVLRARADTGDRLAAAELAELLAKQRRIDELRIRADAGDEHAARRLDDLLATPEYVNQLWAMAEISVPAAMRLAAVLAERGRIDELRHLADLTGGFVASPELAELLAKQGHVDELRARSESGDEHAVHRLADLLLEQDRVDEAIELLQPHADTSQIFLAQRLANLLAKHARIDELRDRADTGDGYASKQLVDFLADQGRLDDLRVEVDAGTYGAAARLVELLTDEEKIGQGDAEQLRRHGLNADGLIYDPNHD
jgi:predicted negative regulator of RcsB-dependent stress response